jgi:hypothetical protein
MPQSPNELGRDSERIAKNRPASGQCTKVRIGLFREEWIMAGLPPGWKLVQEPKAL